jgi:hypothetical protein
VGGGDEEVAVGVVAELVDEDAEAPRCVAEANPINGSIRSTVPGTFSSSEIYWLPQNGPSLNLIERLWRHLKRVRHCDPYTTTFGGVQREVCYGNPPLKLSR